MISFEVTLEQIKAQRALSLLARDYVPVQHCAHCAGDIDRRSHIEAVIYGESVACCSGRCLAQLIQVWAPRKRHYPALVPLLVVLLMAGLALWH